MANESIGTARIDLVGDSSQLEIAVNTAKRSVSSMSQAAQAEYNKLNVAEKRRVDSLIKQADTLGFTRQQQILYNASLKGVPLGILDALKIKLGATGTAATKAGIELNKYGVSAKQNAAALRGVPAQLTDVFTSLQGGQNPFTVLLQQGGQLKDMFGGIRPAAAALGSSIVGLINPFTVAAGAVLGLIVAWNQGDQAAAAFNRALILTGNYADTTAGQLNTLAEEMDGLSGVTTRSASAALAQVASTGQFTGEQLTLVATAAEEMRVATGKAIDETVAEFVRLKKDPVDAILELNDKYHFLTQSQLDNIQTLQEQGRVQEAATEAMRVYADTISSRAPEVNQNLGLMAGAWVGVKNSATEAWDAVVQGIARADRQAREGADSLTQFLSRVSNLGTVGGMFGFASAPGGLPSTGGKGAASAAVDSAAARKAIEDRKKAEEEWGRLATSNLSKQEKLTREIADIRALGLKTGKSELEIQKQIAQAQARYKESLPKGSKAAKAKETDPTEALLARIKQQVALNEEQARSEETLTSSERLRVQVLQEIERLGGKVTAGRRAEINTLLDQLKTTDALVVAQKAEAKLKEDMERLTNQLAAAEESRRQANQADLMGIGRGGNAVDMLRRQLDIQREYVDGLKQLRDKGVAEDSASYKLQEQALRESLERSLELERQYQEARAQMQADWKNGAFAAVDDFVAYTDDVAGRTREFFSGTFDAATSGFADFITGTKSAKEAFGDFADYLFQKSAKMVADKALGALLKKFGPQRDDADPATGFNNAATALAASAAPLSAAAAALTASAAALSAAGLGNAAGGSSSTNYAEAAGNLFDLFSGDWGFSSGGWTGNGPRNKAAGFVHGQEGVLNAGAMRTVGIANLNRLNEGATISQIAPASRGGNIYNNTTFLLPSRYTPQTQAQIDQNNQRVQSRATQRNS
jgi:lambda family phage tail tape measure protein